MTDTFDQIKSSLKSTWLTSICLFLQTTFPFWQGQREVAEDARFYLVSVAVQKRYRKHRQIFRCFLLLLQRKSQDSTFLPSLLAGRQTWERGRDLFRIFSAQVRKIPTFLASARELEGLLSLPGSVDRGQNSRKNVSFLLPSPKCSANEKSFCFSLQISRKCRGLIGEKGLLLICSRDYIRAVTVGQMLFIPL